MKTQLKPVWRATPEGQEAEEILRACVHCGFCTATCPTYQELCDERDGPRGRIYLIKQLLEGGEVTERTRTHLDRCLQCRSCETTCPSGVRYGRLIDIGKAILEQEVPRSGPERWKRNLLRAVLPKPARFAPLLKAGQAMRPLLPPALRRKVPAPQRATPWPKDSHPRVMLALAGCVQSVATPNTNAAAARVLDRLGITLAEAPGAGCCGAVSQHLSATEEARDYMRRNIDAWWPAIEQGAEAIIISASGCGAMVREYGHLLRDDPAYADKAARVSALARDLAEVLAGEDLEPLKPHLKRNLGRVAVHCPCTLQHALGQGGVVERILARLGIELAPVQEGHLCCGSAGTYSILQPELSQRLLKRKVAALTGGEPERIVTANVGCQLHLQSGTTTPVQHWIELLDPGA